MKNLLLTLLIGFAMVIACTRKIAPTGEEIATGNPIIKDGDTSHFKWSWSDTGALYLTPGVGGSLSLDSNSIYLKNSTTGLAKGTWLDSIGGWGFHDPNKNPFQIETLTLHYAQVDSRGNITWIPITSSSIDIRIIDGSKPCDDHYSPIRLNVALDSAMADSFWTDLKESMIKLSDKWNNIQIMQDLPPSANSVHAPAVTPTGMVETYTKRWLSLKPYTIDQ